MVVLDLFEQFRGLAELGRRRFERAVEGHVGDGALLAELAPEALGLAWQNGLHEHRDSLR